MCSFTAYAYAHERQSHSRIHFLAPALELTYCWLLAFLLAMRQLAEYFTESANQPPVPGLRVPTPTRKLLPHLPLCFKKSSIRSSTVAGKGEVTGLSLAGRSREQLVEEFDSPIENLDVAFRVVGHKGILNQFPLFQYLGKRFKSSASS